MADQEKDAATVTEEKPVATDAEAGDEEFKFVEDPTFDVEYKGECAYEVKVVVPAANRQKQADTLFDELKHDAEVPGFRRGRAPRKLIERKFSKAVRSEVEQKLVSAAFRKLLTDKSLKPIGAPDIEGIEESQGKDDVPLSFTLKFEVTPKIELGKYRGIAVERPVVTVKDSDCEEAVNELRERYATFETLAEGVAADGDQLIISFEGQIDGEPFQGGKATDYPYILGTKRFFPEFEKALLGSSAGDELKCDVTFPEETPSEKLRGKTANFTINVSEVKRKVLPELSDDFAKLSGYENVDDLRTKVAERLNTNSKQMSESIARRRALEEVVKNSTYEIPKSLIEAVAHEHFEREVRHLMSHRVHADAIMSRTEELMKEARESAITEIKQMVALNEVGEAEGIEVTDEDFEKEAEALATQWGMDTDTVSHYLASENDRRSMYESRIYRNKALNVIMEHAVVTDKEVPADALDEEQEHDHHHDHEH
ncbi:MAG: trigger factor [Candidatus Hydrogenedentes bacterium]|nr:trigger factor [Candidatus Hydrogenedentota bacterium]